MSEQQSTYNRPIVGSLVAKDATDSEPGIALLLLDGGDIRWSQFALKQEGTPLPPPPPQPTTP